MKYHEASRDLVALRRRLDEIRSQMREVLAETEPQPVDDQTFETVEGQTSLRELFGRRKDLIFIHNMGESCSYCTLWADGYNGLYHHIKRRASFVIASPDTPSRQKAVANRRGWRFPMVSDPGARFARDMGYATRDGRCRPGLSVLRREGSRLWRVSDAASKPHDDFCALWHLFDLLPGGAGSWSPSLKLE